MRSLPDLPKMANALYRQRHFLRIVGREGSVKRPRATGDSGEGISGFIASSLGMFSVGV